MRVFALLLIAMIASGQSPDPAYGALSKAYDALRAVKYEEAIGHFLEAIAAAPNRAAVRKDLAYTYLKIGENEDARDQFREAMRLDPKDVHAAKEYAFLCHETKQTQQARRIFDRLRREGDPTAAQAFENIDRPLRDGIERWRNAIAMGADNFSSHYELATLAEQRAELELAAEHYERAWRILPERKGVLLDLGRVWKGLNRLEDANAALLAASRGGQAHAAEKARELLPSRYPHVYEFQNALALDQSNAELRREFAFLLLRMEREPEAEDQLRIIVEQVPDDLLSAAQLALLYWGHLDRAHAQPLFERVLAGGDEELANRIRAVLRMPQVLRKRANTPAASADAKLMAERSIKAGYMKDALKYLQIAHEADPADFGVMLKLGWTYNGLHDDRLAVRWFNLAKRSTDPLIATEARKAFERLRPDLAPVRISAWVYPFYSSRWQAGFSYGQVKAEWNRGWLRPYVSTRFIGDVHGARESAIAGNLSESAFIVGAGLATVRRHGLLGWFEAGSAMSYRTGHMLPDYRGGLSLVRATRRSSGWFAETGTDAVFVSRFGNDVLFYSQNRVGVRTGPVAWFLNANLTQDLRREYWANFGEFGPGVRFGSVQVSFLRGIYTRNEANPRRPNFFDLRAGFWYALSH